ncbi:MAG: single-stranded DNA-binding protein [candidate division KSB1 bacterium]|nr:single-stranded DNA-binding protein [candidate division KSB1 bacterium]
MSVPTKYDLPDVNRVVISGEVLVDPPLRSTRRGVPVTNFTIASVRLEPQPEGPPREERSYIRIVAWSNLAEHCHRLLRKGDQVVIIGELQTASASGASGQQTYLQVNAKWVQFPQGRLRENRERGGQAANQGAAGDAETGESGA